MTSRERFECALAHRTPDRIPIDYLAVPVIDAKLKQFYGVDTEQWHAPQNLVHLLK
jgi:hypothetical protein